MSVHATSRSVRTPMLPLLAALATSALLITAPARAGEKLADCADAVTPSVAVQDEGLLESLVFDASGRLLYTNATQKALKVVAQRGAAPTVLAGNLSEPGGIALGDQHDAYVGSGNGLGGLLPSLGLAKLIHIDLHSGTQRTYAKGLSMTNGVVRAANGTIYASNDFARSLDRVLPDGTVQRGWIKQIGNGMALSPDGQTLYVNQSLPAKVLAIDLTTEPPVVRTHAVPPPSSALVFLDGLTLAPDGNLYTAAFLAGQLWRITPDSKICVLARGMPMISAVAAGREEQGFSRTSLYTTTFAGKVWELPGVLP